jgi:indoleamine 2,3-dioxygenase
MDEDWFFLITADIESKAVPGVISCLNMMKSIENDNKKEIINQFQILKHSLGEMTSSLKQMKTMCSPFIFYNRVRLYLSGWEKGSEKFPNGVVYEGISKDPQYLLGGSAAQSSPMHIFDEFFGVKHKNSLLSEMREYMPKEHREFIYDVNKWSNGSKLNDFVADSQSPELNGIYNETLENISEFRSTHIQIVTSYIISQSKNLDKEKGTGSSSLIPFLKNVRDETMERKFVE